MAKREADIAAMLGAQLAKVSDSDTGREQIEYIDLDLLDPDPRNFYNLPGIPELAENIRLVGLQQPLRVRPKEGGHFEIVTGHRRHRALLRLAKEEGLAQFAQVPCIRERTGESSAMERIRLICGNCDNRTMSSAELAQQAEELEAALLALKQEGYEFSGRTREKVAQLLQVSSTKLGVLKVIREKLVPGYLELFNADKLPEASAYALAKMPETLQKDIFVACKGKVNGHALEKYQKKVKEGLPESKEPLRCPPDGQQLCTHKAAFLRHDCNDSWDQCWGVTCCMECEKAMREYSPCASACSKAKAAKSAKLAARKQKEEKRKEKEVAKNQAASEPVAAFWRRMQASAQKQFGDAVIDKITGSPYYRNQVKNLIAGTFKASSYDDGTTTYPRLDYFRKFCVENQVSADVLLDLPAAAQPQGQLTICGWMPGSTTPAEPGDFAVLADFGAGYLVREFYSWDGENWIFAGGEAEDLPSWWLRLPPEPGKETGHG